MAEYIEREGAYPLAKRICDAVSSGNYYKASFGMQILDWIDDIPAADVVSHEWVIEHMSGDYISREKAIENVLDQMKHSTSENAMRERLLNLVAADVRPVVRGKWTGNKRHQSCSECHMTYCVPDGQDGELDLTAYHFCPNCGADMREGS